LIIYKVTNNLNGKVYIGQTIRPLIVRWKQHCNPCNKNCIALHRAIQKYGKENFSIQQIDIACDRDELDKKEIYWINFYNSTNSEKGYNLRVGGEHGYVSEETRIKISKSATGKFVSDETKRKMSIAHKSFKMSKESIAKSVESKRKNGVYEKIAKLAALNGKKSSKKIRCIETNKIYESITDASKSCNLARSNISACLNGVTKTCGKLHWEFI
jgi:group I intron endonuclease